ncbi:purine-cytosine permease family protein [Microbacterium arabinogalactanolyticum]|uniref:purine-cytosine permease family protein n=1 Tax=Microbacterium arabinogalactanolyticum TaxID=69365 RepID=UPI002556C5D7|nr:cytosine permease [Microbacterium arabinogalactanolyticum]GLC84872.1 cytosine permease [Microbacterium arabinogalactanolyticum]
MTESAAGTAAATASDASASDEFEREPVPESHRKSLFTVSAVWFGFPMILTNAVPGGLVVAMLGFWQGVGAILVANAIMFVYVSLLSWRAGRTGKSFSLQAIETFGTAGYAIASGFLSTVVVGWFAFNTGATGATLSEAFGWNEMLVAAVAGVVFIAVTYLGIRALSVLGTIAAPLFIFAVIVAVVIASQTADFSAVLSYGGEKVNDAMTFGVAVTAIMATFADSGTMTADFTRWARNGKEAVLATVTAFPIASLVAQLSGGVLVAAGAIALPAVNGGNFAPILTGTGNPLLNVFLLLFVVINLGSVCTHCLYNGALGWSHLTRSKMRLLTLILGVIGVIVAVLGAWQFFANWLALLGVLVPPLGAVLIADQIILARRNAGRPEKRFRVSALIAWAIGAGFALISHFFAPALSDAVVGLVVGCLAYLALEQFTPKKEITR